MKHLRLLGAMALFVLSCALGATAAPRVIINSGQNPLSTQTNQAARYLRIDEGTFLRDLLGNLTTTGAYTNLSIVAGSGLYVTLNPTNASQAAALYQFGQDDVNPIPAAGTPNLPADPTQLLLMGTQLGNSSALGPFTPPATGGYSVYYLVEAQLTSVDGNPQSLLFVNSSGLTYYQTVNTERTDTITYQLKEGTPGASPTPPTVDSGWISIGTVEVANGQTQIVSGNIAMTSSTTFSGIVLTVSGSGDITATGTSNVTIACAACVDTGTELQEISSDKQFAQGNYLYMNYPAGVGVKGGTVGMGIGTGATTWTFPQSGSPQAVPTAAAATFVVMGPASGNVFQVYSNSGLTPGVSFTPSPILQVSSAGNLAVTGTISATNTAILNNGVDNTLITSTPLGTECGVGSGGLYVTDASALYGPFIDVGLSPNGGSGLGICTSAGNIIFDGTSWQVGTCNVASGPGTCTVTFTVNVPRQCNLNYTTATTAGQATLYNIIRTAASSGTTLTGTGGTSASGSNTIGIGAVCL